MIDDKKTGRGTLKLNIGNNIKIDTSKINLDKNNTNKETSQISTKKSSRFGNDFQRSNKNNWQEKRQNAKYNQLEEDKRLETLLKNKNQNNANSAYFTSTKSSLTNRTLELIGEELDISLNNKSKNLDFESNKAKEEDIEKDINLEVIDEENSDNNTDSEYNDDEIIDTEKFVEEDETTDKNEQSIDDIKNQNTIQNLIIDNEAQSETNEKRINISKNQEEFVKKDDGTLKSFKLIDTKINDVKDYVSNLDAKSVLEKRKKAEEMEKEEKERIRIAALKEKKRNTNLRSGLLGISTDENDIQGEILNRPFISRRPKPKFRNFQREEKKIIIQEVLIDGPISIKDLANAINIKTKDVVKFVNRLEKKRYDENQMLNPDLSELIVLEYGHKPIVKTFRTIDSLIFERLKNSKNPKKRPPVVTIMGHVDHGKTSLLDAFRSSNIVAQESGGITQHIGAYQITTKSGEKISFIDTPGHEAFTSMRARGSKATDIVILVVAADDGIMPQTIESINHVHAAGVPMIVAVNKIDKTNGDVTNILNQLIQYEVITEQLGGEIMAIPISAKNKTNLDKLEEAILLQAEILELKADYSNKATGVIIESKVNNIKGCCATLLIQDGTLKISDCLITNNQFCKVRSMLSEHGQQVKIAEPSTAVEVFGFQTPPEVGQKFIVLESEKEAKNILKEFEEIEEKQKNLEELQIKQNKSFDLNSILGLNSNQNSDTKELKFIIKADVSGTIDAVKYSLDKLNSDKLKISVIHSGTGTVTDSDVSLAKTTGAVIAGFKISVQSNINNMIQKEGITIRIYDIIYQLIDDVSSMIENKLKPQKIEKYLGKLIVKQVFEIGGTGKIAGCLVEDGTVSTNNFLRIKRKNNIVKEEVKISVLKRFKEDVREVKQGLECGIACLNFTDIEQGDIIEAYTIIENK